MPKPKVFVSYSHRDREWKERLVEHLETLELEGLLDLWEDKRIPVGSDWLREIQKAIEEARVAVLLVSRSFLRSRFIRQNEIPALLARRMTEGLQIVPVILSSCLWDSVSDLSSIQVLPQDGRPLASFRGDNTERELVAIAREILHLVSVKPAISRPTEALRPLHQLPHPPADFVGREAELSALRSAMQKGGFTICGLRGMGGVGKTALALELAHEFHDVFPDGQIYLDLRGESEKPVTSGEAMAHVIRSFHPEAKFRVGPQLAGLYLEVLHGKRVLLLMDNASGKAQIDPLLPPEGCVLLVTSRVRFSLPGILRLDLRQLPENDACNFLLQIVPRIGDQAAAIARLCGYLPFALRVAASTLADQAGLTAVGYVHRLEQEEQKAKLGEGALGLSYALLPEIFQSRFRTLAVFPADFDGPAAAATWGLGGKKGEADEVLDELVRRSLLDGEEGRYKLHDLARAFAAARCTEKEREEAQEKHAEHFLGVLAAAKELYKEGNENTFAGLALFDLDRAHILAGQAWAAERTNASEGAARLASHFPHAGAYLLQLRLSLDEQIRWLEAGLAGSRRLNERAMEGNHLGALGLAYAGLGEPLRAIEFQEQYLAIASETGDRRGQGAALGNLGLAYADWGETQRAIESLEAALRISREIGDKRSEGSIFGNLGLAYDALGQAQRAIKFYELHLDIAREIGDQLGEATSSWNLGLTFEKLGDFARALDCIQVCVDLDRQVGRPDAEKYSAYLKWLRARAHAQAGG